MTDPGLEYDAELRRQNALRAEVRRQAAGLASGQIDSQLGEAERFAGRSEDDRVIYEEWYRISYLMQPDPHPDSMCWAGTYDPARDAEPLLCRRRPKPRSRTRWPTRRYDPG